MIKIIINNSYTKLENTNKKIDEELKQLLSYEKSSSQYWQRYNPHLIWVDVKKYLFNKKIHKFPTGLLSRVKEYLYQKGIHYTEEDKREKPVKMYYWGHSLTGEELRYYQRDAINQALYSQRGTIEAATGTGKTKIMQYIIKELGVSTLVIVPSLNILNQTYELFKLNFGNKYVDTIHKMKWRKKQRPIIIGNIQSVINKKDKFFDQFNCLCVDEAHHSAANSYTYLNKKQFDHIYHRYYLSATPYRNDGTDLELFGLIGDIIYSYSTTTALKDGYIVKPYFYIHSIKNKGVKKYKNYFEEYQDLIVKNKKRNELIKQNALKLLDKDHQVLIIVEQVAHGFILNKLIKDSVYINGEMKQDYNKKMLLQFNNKKFKILIATSVCGEGIDLPGVHCLINAAGGKAKSEVIQRVGRVLRIADNKDKAIIVDFLDENSKYLKKHSLERIKYYEQFQTPITILI
jgi:superfamily II DNA or RNA helicase